MQAVHNITSQALSPHQIKALMTASSLCVLLYISVGHTGEQKAKGEHFYTLDLLAFSFMSLEGGGQEMSVHVYMCVHMCVIVQLLL